MNHSCPTRHRSSRPPHSYTTSRDTTTSGWLRLLQPCLPSWIGAWLAFKSRHVGSRGLRVCSQTVSSSMLNPVAILSGREL